MFNVGYLRFGYKQLVAPMFRFVIYVCVCQIKILVRIYTSSPKSNFSLIQQPNLRRGFAVTYHRYVNIKCVKRPESSSCISSTIYLWGSLKCDEFSDKLFYLTYSHSCVCFQLFNTTFCNFHKFRDIHLVLGLKFATLCSDYLSSVSGMMDLLLDITDGHARIIMYMLCILHYLIIIIMQMHLTVLNF